MSDNQNQIPISVTSAQQQQQQQQTLKPSNINGTNLKIVPSNSNKNNTHINLLNHNNINLNNIINNSGSKLTSNENDLYDIIDIAEFQNFINNQKNLLIDNKNSNTIEDVGNIAYQENKVRVRNKPTSKIIDIITNENLNDDKSSSITNGSSQKMSSNSDNINASNLNNQKNHRYESILLKELMQLGIKREKIEKALAATGYQNSMDAINWLMKHSKDPVLNQDIVQSTRDYILVLCPVGRLANQISTFFQQAKLKCGANEAHYTNLLPFMKLTPFFKIYDSDVINLHKAFDLIFKPVQMDGPNSLQVINKKARISEINIDLHVSSQMLLLYPDIDSENLIKEVIAAFGKLAFKLSNFKIKLTVLNYFIFLKLK